MTDSITSSIMDPEDFAALKPTRKPGDPLTEADLAAYNEPAAPAECNTIQNPRLAAKIVADYCLTKISRKGIAVCPSELSGWFDLYNKALQCLAADYQSMGVPLSGPLK